MQKGETISEVQKRFSHIVNHLMGLGKTFKEDELNIKILKCLDRTWQSKVTTHIRIKRSNLNVYNLFVW